MCQNVRFMNINGKNNYHLIYECVGGASGIE